LGAIDKKVLIIDSGRATEAAIETALLNKQDALVVSTLEDIPDELNTAGMQYAISIPYLPKPTFYFGEKEFICKGNHQYREIKWQWICQCGRKIND
jgi:hypothetical protein